MLIPIINYLLAVLIVFLGLPLGILTAKIAEEEIVQYKKEIGFFTKITGYKYHKSVQIISVLLLFISSYNLTAFILTAGIVFIYFTSAGILLYNEKHKNVKKIKLYGKNSLYLIVLKENSLFLIISLLLPIIIQIFF